MDRWFKLALCAVSVVFVIAWAKPQLKSDIAAYQTVVGTGPDKWATVWLVRQHLNPSPVTITATESQFAANAISFDTTSSELTRTGTSTTYSAFLAAHAITDPVTVKLGAIIHDIEINAWNPNREIESLQVENAFRQMQLTFGRDKVTQRCYMQFFDRVAEAIDTTGITLQTDATQFIPNDVCLTEPDVLVQTTNQSALVPELNLQHVLDAMSSSNNVVFVDTREAFEFKEGHIPGAVNYTLREIDATVANKLKSADLVVAYCVKDFRGFEAARTLKRYGVNAAIMNPYGIKGWRNAGLPVAGSRGMSELDAANAMQELLQQHINTKTNTI